MVGTLGYYVAGTPKSAKWSQRNKSQQNKKWWERLEILLLLLLLGNKVMGTCKPKFLNYYNSLKRNFEKKSQFDNFVRHRLNVNHWRKDSPQVFHRTLERPFS